MKLINKTFIIAAAAALTTACTDYDNNYDDRKIAYEEAFKDVFGNIDPKQDWTMAKQISANVDLTNVNGECTVTVYDKAPMSNKASILYRSNVNGGGNYSFSFDAPKTINEVYTSIKSNFAIISDYTDISSGNLTIKPKRSPANSCPVTLGTPITDDALLGTYYGTVLKENIESGNKTNCESFADFDAVLNSSYWPFYIDGDQPNTFKLYEKDGNGGYNIITIDAHNYATYSQAGKFSYYFYSDGSKWNRPYSYTPPFKFYQTQHGNKYSELFTIYNIEGVEKTEGGSVYISDIDPIVGKGGVFNERGHADSNPIYCNLAKWYNDLNAEKGAEYILAEDGPIEFDFFYGGTKNKNQLGYFYYSDGESYEEAIKHPHYILCDAMPMHNVKVDGSWNLDADGMTLPGYVDAYDAADPKSTADKKFTASHYKLAYFGESGTQQNGSYTFPKGTHIVLFLVQNGLTATNSYGYKIENSVPEFNKIEGKFWESSRLHQHDNDYCTMAVGGGELDAVTYNWGGMTVLGFEDRDEDDMNDILLFIKGNFTNEIKELKDEDDVYEWMVACEDLGGSDDYDFNDVVFGVKKYDHKTTLYKEFYVNGELVSKVPAQVEQDHYLIVTPYAAGASLQSVIINDTYPMPNKTVHELLLGRAFGESQNGSMPWINTLTKGKSGSPIIVSLTEEQANSFTMSSANAGGFKIRVTNEDGTKQTVQNTTQSYNKDESSNAPQMLVLPNGWEWPKERVNIGEAYPGFTNWVGDKTNLDWLNDWNNNKVNTNVVK